MAKKSTTKKKRYPHDIATALRNAIKSMEGNRLAIATQCDISPSILYRFVSSERGISLDSASKLMKKLDLVIVPRSELP